MVGGVRCVGDGAAQLAKSREEVCRSVHADHDFNLLNECFTTTTEGKVPLMRELLRPERPAPRLFPLSLSPGGEAGELERRRSRRKAEQQGEAMGHG